MKRAAAIILGLIFLWLQAVSSAQMAFLPAKAARTCCGCQQRDCCVTPATPDPQSLPATVAATGSQNHLSVLASTLVAWTLPASAPAQVFVSASAPLMAPDVPLFTRYCARLI
jgi:hypothetical protein